MGRHFKQRDRTIHLGIELMDRFFLDPKTQHDPDFEKMTARKVNLVLSTCFMVASKYEEVDDRLVFIGDI
jgi:hypothetical protein